MGRYYLFKLNVMGNDIEKVCFEQINNIDLEYIMYDKFLTTNYATSIEENEDYIAYVNEKTAIMILDEALFDKDKLENVFEILYDSLYENRGEEYEKNNNSKWISKIG